MKLTLTITTAGLERFTAAQLADDLDLTIAKVGLTDAVFVVAPTLDKLPGEFRRLSAISGQQVGDNIVHMTMRDDEEIGYTARGFGLFLADGTLFAVYGQADRLFEKSPRAAFLSAIDIAFPTGDVRELRFGDTNFLNPPATTEVKGVVELATLAEGAAGSDPVRVTTVAVARAMIVAAVSPVVTLLTDLTKAVDESIKWVIGHKVLGSGLVTGGGTIENNPVLSVAAATPEQVREGADHSVALTPWSLRNAYSSQLGNTGWRIHPDGFVEMWGQGDRPPNEGEFTLNFPRAFPNACAGVLPMTINTNKTVDGQTTVQEVALYPDRAVLFAQNHQSTCVEAGGFRWRAWGY
ncbi:phage tail protein [Sphingomonas pseudosanguinis]|uniref:Putative tail fiber protein gp53-like C-terminal domain-containing protein n=1 Tax=Sphingomonas pseudosanguinis TaxID=413712 RepID=A0A7W6ABX8_9SPHN|nr:phage tail protein [Sphingomonas pseudosanguinis]MBB3877901.1 hypothetical protein [Sphingomonas pseudosanguinis]